MLNMLILIVAEEQARSLISCDKLQMLMEICVIVRDPEENVCSDVTEAVYYSSDGEWKSIRA